MPITGTAAPGTGPGVGPGAWSGDRAAAAGPEHGAGHSFLRQPPAPALEPRWPVASTPPRCHHHLAHHGNVESSRRGRRHPGGYRDPSPHRRHHHDAQRTGPCPYPGRLWSHVQGSRPSPTAAPAGSLPRTPLPAPGGEPGDGTPTPPVSIWTVRKFFQKFNPRKETLRVTASRPNLSRNKIRLANPAFRDDSGTSLRDPYLPLGPALIVASWSPG
jgi:hypothetical protein